MYKGDKIHGSCKKTYFESKGRLLPVGAWRNVRNFHVRPAGGAFRTINHTYKIVFNQATAVTRSNFTNDELYLNLVDFQTVLNGTLDENLLIGKDLQLYFINLIIYFLQFIYFQCFFNRCAGASFGLW